MNHQVEPTQNLTAVTSAIVAVMMAVYRDNDVEQLKESIESVVQQTFDSFILLIYVDGPVSPAIDKVLQEFSSPKLIVLRGDVCRGLPYCLNQLIEYVLAKLPTVKYFARMDTDDISVGERLTTQFAFMEANSRVHVIGSWCMEFGGGGAPFLKRLPVHHHDLVRFSCYRSPLVHPTAFIRRSVFADGFRYNPDLTKAQDYDLWSRLILNGYIFGNIPESLLQYRVGNMHNRRSGILLVWRETSMRLSYSMKKGFISPVIYLRILAFFLVRISPRSIRKMAYKYFRS